MSSPLTTRLVIAQLLGDVKDELIDELHRRLHDAGFTDIRPAHGCVFRHVPPEGMRLSEMADAARMTKQAVGEHVLDLERLGYVERVPDPDDGRAKLIRPTEKGAAAKAAAHDAFDAIEREWGEAVGGARVAEMRETLDAIRTLARST